MTPPPPQRHLGDCAFSDHDATHLMAGIPYCDLEVCRDSAVAALHEYEAERQADGQAEDNVRAG